MTLAKDQVQVQGVLGSRGAANFVGHGIARPEAESEIEMGYLFSPATPSLLRVQQ